MCLVRMLSPLKARLVPGATVEMLVSSITISLCCVFSQKQVASLPSNAFAVGVNITLHIGSSAIILSYSSSPISVSRSNCSIRKAYEELNTKLRTFGGVTK